MQSAMNVLRTIFVLCFLFANARAAEPAALGEIARRMQDLVNRKAIAGAVTLVAQHGKTVHLAAVGSADIGEGRAMKTDDLFWIASMTKPMTAVCVMILVEQGKLSADDPVEKFIPEFSALRLGGAKPPRPVTIRDLLTHTGGLGDANIPPKASLAERVTAYVHAPMRFAPGTRWEYCNGGFNTLGRVIEVVSGKSYDAFLRQHLLSPLGMRDTTFWPAPRRVAKSYRSSAAGLAETSVYARPSDISDRSRPALAAGGLFSTASDVARFYQMILSGGSLGSRRILSSRSVAAMTSLQTGGMKAGFVDGMGWGLGFQIVRSSSAATAALSPGSFGHGGSFATQSWADPSRDAIYVLMIQRAGYANADNTEARRIFQDTAAAALR